MNTKQLINQEELQELKIQNNKLKSLLSEYFEINIGNPYLRKEESKKEIIKLIKIK